MEKLKTIITDEVEQNNAQTKKGNKLFNVRQLFDI